MEQNTAMAKLKYLRIAPLKVGLQANLIRGLPVTEAQAQLMLFPGRASEPILKLLNSAIANAKVGKLDPHKLFVKELRIDRGPTQKRWTPRARGAWSPIRKRTSHVTIVLGVSPSPSPARFVIHERPKKEKDGGKKSKKPSNKKETVKETVDKEAADKKHSKAAGGLRRIFRRKAM